ncbi:MAG TPA: tetratricopeptide repeat protein [Candidatus Omnitrophota bacterium]|nr:tetratricopeptide repeat protein [Candidatus Omnitrophota bacterium]HRZ14826.1 tetratricopeptide repeat protein [Candidatus Omnitrophota bacterium]
MPRRLSSLVAVLLIACACAGCMEDQYSLERGFWKIKKQAELVFRNPKATPMKEVDRVIGLFDGFIARYPKNVLALSSEFQVARLYLVKEEYDKGRQRLKRMLIKYKKLPVVCSEIQHLNATSYQMQDQWATALEEFKKVYQQYSLTQRGLETPLYIGLYYKSKVEPDKMIAALNEAIEHYYSVIQKYPESAAAFRSYAMITAAYGLMKRWPEAAQNISVMIEKFKDKVPMDRALFDLAVLYRKELKDTARARAALLRLTGDYPKSKLVKLANELLKTLK